LQVVVPYRPGMLFARTYDAAKAWEGGCRFVKLRNRGEKPDPDQYNPTYPELLADLWEQGEDVMMLEHDVVPYADSLAEIACCREPWCGFGYPGGGSITKTGTNLGCTKLSSTLLAVTAEWGVSERQRQQRWDHCDARLNTWTTLHAPDVRPHRHYPDVQHRGTRHLRWATKHRLGSDFIDLDEHGEPIGVPRTPYEPLQPPEESYRARGHAAC
jgi:hypothetical protein